MTLILAVAVGGQNLMPQNKRKRFAQGITEPQAPHLHASLLTVRCGSVHPGCLRTLVCLNIQADKSEWAENAGFFRFAIAHIDEELETAGSTNPEFMTVMEGQSQHIRSGKTLLS